ncbi:MAG TPA: PilN domain-containing protein [Blastocatellia bacterium]|nr:PilN domain-containing protein [Blastocatellia bacterium]
MAGKMVKVNLLQEQQPANEIKRTVRKVSGVTQFLLMLVISIVALVVIVGLDFLSATIQSKHVSEQLSEQQARANELKKLTARREELAKQKQAVDDRIAIIKQLRKEQSGPVTMLSQINQRIPDSGLYLFTIKQTDKGIALVGRADNEETVQKFVKNLESSDGVFDAPEVATVLPARFNTRDKLKAHISEMMHDIGADNVNIDSLSNIPEDPKDQGKSVLFALRCNYSRTGSQPAANAAAGAKGPVAALR